MKTNTIQQIEEQVNQVTEALKGFVLRRHEEDRYGKEDEYTAQSLKADIKAILTDIRGLVKAHNKFVRLSTFVERDLIRDSLQNMSSSLNSENYSNAAHYLEKIKDIIRSYNVRGSSESEEVLKERLAQINSKYTDAEENIDEIKRVKETAEQQAQQLQSIKEQLEFIDGRIYESREKADQIEKLQTQSQSNSDDIHSVFTSAKSREEIINSFVQRVEERQKQLDTQEQSTAAYQEKLESFQEAHEEKLEAAEKLIEEARAALELTTAAGVSAAFTARYNEEKERDQEMLDRWLRGALLFMSIAIGMGIWVVLGNKDIGLGLAISRITIIPVVLSGAWFCAAQYVRYRNIREDYGYKAVLSKSMIAFMDHLPEDVKRDYLNTVLKEIHKNPLRKRYDDSDRKNIRTPDDARVGTSGSSDDSDRKNTGASD